MFCNLRASSYFSSYRYCEGYTLKAELLNLSCWTILRPRTILYSDFEVSMQIVKNSQVGSEQLWLNLGRGISYTKNLSEL